MIFDFAIIGGGAAGLVCAAKALQNGKTVCLLESNDRVGKKLLATGNGKCNLSNENISVSHYNNSFPFEVLSRYGTQSIMDFYFSLGLKTKTIEGRVYPYSESGASVLSVLTAVTEKVTKTNYTVEHIVEKLDCYIINDEIKAKKIVLATGSAATFGRSSYNLYAPFGHKVTELNPSLAPLITDTKYIGALSGLRAKAKITLYEDNTAVASECGEILFKENGISGIAVFMLSAVIARAKGNYTISIDFVPNIKEDEAELLPINGYVRRLIGLALAKQAADRSITVYACLKDFRLNVKSVSNVKTAQVISGGLSIEQFFPLTLESKLKKGLFAVGEVLDVDGVCGGYNLHWAFASAMTVANGV